MRPAAENTRRRGYAWWPRRRSIVFDASIALFCAVEAAFTSYGQVSRWLGDYAWIGSVVAVCCVGALVLRRRFPNTVAVIACCATPLYGNFTFLLVALYSLGAYSRRSWRMPAIGAATVLVQFAWIMFVPGVNSDVQRAPAAAMWFIIPSIVTTTIVAPLLLGLYIGTRRRMIINLRERAEQLEREQHLLADRVVTAERTRIAREMHDVVAHRLTHLVVFSDALRSVVAKNPDEAVKAAKVIGDASREALDELRQIIGVLRLAEGDDNEVSAPQPTLEDVPELLSQSQSAGIPVELTVDGERAKIPAGLELAAYRVIQESLTNVRKHAGKVTSEVALGYEPNRLTVRVSNAMPTQPGDARVPSGGHGIIGMRERVVMHNGTFAAGHRPDGGFEVTAVFPIAARA